MPGTGRTVPRRLQYIEINAEELGDGPGQDKEMPDHMEIAD